VGALCLCLQQIFLFFTPLIQLSVPMVGWSLVAAVFSYLENIKKMFIGLLPILFVEKWYVLLMLSCYACSNCLVPCWRLPVLTFSLFAGASVDGLLYCSVGPHVAELIKALWIWSKDCVLLVLSTEIKLQQDNVYCRTGFMLLLKFTSKLESNWKG